MNGELQPFLTHLHEVRRRLLYVLACAGVGSIVGYVYYRQILDFLLRPLQQPLYYSSPAGGFDVIFKVSIGTGLMSAIPMAIYQTLRFLAPALPPSVNRRVRYYVLASTLLLLLGMSFAYYISMPAALHFLATFGSPHLNSLISAQEYFSFLMRYLLGFGLLFQMPLFLLIVNAVKPLPISKLLKSGRYVLLGSFILAAVLTPTPDVANQIMLALPIILLYYTSVFIIWVLGKK